MADGAYERRAGREAELRRFERILRESALSRSKSSDSSLDSFQKDDNKRE